MKKVNYISHIRTVPDYPVAGINFYDMNSLFGSPVWPECAAELAAKITGDPTHIVGIESRGFVVGAAIAQHLGLPVVMVRKKGTKYPGPLLEESYALEYGSDSLVLQEGRLDNSSRVVIADDLVATGGSMMAAKRLTERTGAHVIGGAAVINLKYANGDELKDFPLAMIYEAQE